MSCRRRMRIDVPASRQCGKGGMALIVRAIPYAIMLGIAPYLWAVWGVEDIRKRGRFSFRSYFAKINLSIVIIS